MTDEKEYLTQVEKVMAQLRARCLGQDARLTALLPPHAREKDAQYQAKYLAAQLQFALVHAEGRYIEPKELQRCRQWLEDIILYLLEKVQDEDHTFCSLVRMVNLPQETRRLVLYEFLPTDSELLTGEPPELLRRELDATIWWLLGVQGKHAQGRHFLSALCSFIDPIGNEVIQ